MKMGTGKRQLHCLWFIQQMKEFSSVTFCKCLTQFEQTTFFHFRLPNVMIDDLNFHCQKFVEMLCEVKMASKVTLSSIKPHGGLCFLSSCFILFWVWGVYIFFLEFIFLLFPLQLPLQIPYLTLNIYRQFSTWMKLSYVHMSRLLCLLLFAIKQQKLD